MRIKKSDQISRTRRANPKNSASMYKNIVRTRWLITLTKTKKRTYSRLLRVYFSIFFLFHFLLILASFKNQTRNLKKTNDFSTFAVKGRKKLPLPKLNFRKPVAFIISFLSMLTFRGWKMRFSPYWSPLPRFASIFRYSKRKLVQLGLVLLE